MSGTNLSFAGFLSDVRNPTAPLALQKIYAGAATDEGARILAHQFANDIVAVLSGGQPGIALTHITYVSSRSGNKEIWEMDYEGANPHQLTHLKTIALTPRWSPDAERIAFTCYAPYRGIVSAQICIYSLASNRMISFPRIPGNEQFAGMVAGWIADRIHVEPEWRSGNLRDECRRGRAQRITYARGVNTSPVWNPKTGKQIVFVSDRSGNPDLYLANSDGSNVERINLPDMGYVIDPAWSPNGQLVAFSWRRPSGNYDIYAMDIISHQLVELTRDAGRNERPSWAPDGRHLVFESTRTGTRQIWSVLADGSEPRQLTFEGQSESPNWSPK